MCGLSQKQIWRRQVPTGKSRVPLASVTQQTSIDFKTDGSNSLVQDSAVKEPVKENCTADHVGHEAGKYVVATAERKHDECLETKMPVKISKGVSFCGYVKVVLIPCVADYKEANLCDVLWWTASDMKGFHNETAITLRKFMQDTQVKDRKRALRMLLEDETIASPASCCV